MFQGRKYGWKQKVKNRKKLTHFQRQKVCYKSFQISNPTLPICFLFNFLHFGVHITHFKATNYQFQNSSPHFFLFPHLRRGIRNNYSPYILSDSSGKHSSKRARDPPIKDRNAPTIQVWAMQNFGPEEREERINCCRNNTNGC